MIFILHLALTLFMTGLIWFVQIIHYPIMREVTQQNFCHYENVHTQRTGWLVAPVMVAELATAGLWTYFNDFSFISIVNLALLLMIWGSTFFIQVPLHQSLSRLHNAKEIDRLVDSNWIRTVLWTIRATLLLLTVY